MASNIYGCIGLNGGSPGDVDTLVDANLNDADMAIAIVGGATDTVYIYTYDSNASGDTSAPDLIKCSGAGTNGRMVLCKMHVDDLTTTDDVTVGDDLIVSGDIDLTGSIDITGGLSFDAGTAVTSIDTDISSVSVSDDTLASAKAIKAYVDAQVAGLTVDVDLLAGLIHGPLFTWVDADTITLGSARVHCLGAAQGENIYKWDSDVTYNFGSAGSNANSDDLGVSEWHYLYIDDSSLTDDSTPLVAANFINLTEAPSWDDSECGYYNAAGDRCIGAFFTDSGSDLREFFHNSTDYIEWRAGISLSSASSTETVYAPSFTRQVRLHIYSGTTTVVYYETANGGTNKLLYENRKDDGGDNQADSNNAVNWEAIVDDSLQCGFSGTATLIQWGYSLPRGII